MSLTKNDVDFIVSWIVLTNALPKRLTKSAEKFLKVPKLEQARHPQDCLGIVERLPKYDPIQNVESIKGKK